MKTSEKTRQTQEIPLITHLGKLTSKFIMAFCAMAVWLCLPAHAGNILADSGFDSSSSLTGTGWLTHTPPTAHYSPNVNTALVLSPPNDLWGQGYYTDGGAPIQYIQYAYQKIASAAGYTYSADAWFSQFVVEPTPTEGGSAPSGPAGQTNYSTGLFGGNMALYSTNVLNTGYYEDGWVEVQFLDAANNILADYKSVIINPAMVHNLASSGAVTGNANGSTNLNWFDVQVTNQYNPSTIVLNGDPDQGSPGNHSPAPTNSVSNGILTAPPGTAFVQYMLVLCQTSYCSGAAHWDNCTLNQLSGFQPAFISNMVPSNLKLFNIAATNFTFNVSSSVGTAVPSNNVQVVENGVDVSKNLKFSGSNTFWTVSLPGLASNTVYYMNITVNNDHGLQSTASTRFDTFDPNDFMVPAEDYDFNGGSFIQSPVPTNAATATSYFGRLGVSNIDYAILSGGVPGGNGASNLKPNYPNRNDEPAWQVASDANLPLYIAQSNSLIYNVNIAYNNPGNWYMYTRNPYPSGGYYQIYARMSDGGSPTTGGSETLQLVTSGAGTTNFVATNNLGYFVLNGAIPGWTPDWSAYYWVPLGRDSSGLNPTVVNLPSGQQTLQLISGNGCNLISLAFVPIPALGLPPYISNFNPPILTPGRNVFVSTNTLTFTVSSLISTIAQSSIHTYVNGSQVPESFTGTPANWTVSVPLSAVANQPAVSFSVSAVDLNGLSNGVSGTFDTFSQTNFMIEAVDFDFNSGHWIDNPLATAGNGISSATPTNSYFYYPMGNFGNAAVYGVDFTTTNVTTAETYLYRLDGSDPLGYPAAGTETNNDFPRSKFVNVGAGAVPPFEYVPGEAVPTTNADFHLAWWPPSTWLNYTRTFPSNSYQVYARLAGGNGAYGVDQTIGPVTMSLVPSGQVLGAFSDPNANGFNTLQSWHWIPLMSNGTNVVLSLNGAETLKVTAPTNGLVTGSVNAHFYMFVPYVQPAPAFSLSASASAGVVSIKIPTTSGHTYYVYWSSSLNPTSWQPLGGSVSGDGTVKTVTDSTTGGSARFYRAVATTP